MSNSEVIFKVQQIHNLNSDLGDYNEAKNFAYFFALNIISFPQVLRWFSIINLEFWTGFT